MAASYRARALPELRFLGAAIVLLVVAMGVGRFAYTPLLPLMEKTGGLAQGMAGVIASSNLVGYLIGALLSSVLGRRARRVTVVRWGIATVIATTGLMAIASPMLWIAARFATGVASGFVFVLASSIVLDRAATEGKHAWPAIFYGGVGLGIMLTGLLVPPLAALGGWRAGWVGLALVCTVLCMLTTPWLTDSASHVKQSAAQSHTRYHQGLFWLLFAVYGAEGLGYIVPATFLVAMGAASASLAPYAQLSWIAVGLVAIPSTIVWNRVGATLGRGYALVFAMTIQAAGVVAPIVARNAVGFVAAAVTLGGTFVGITALATTLGREIHPDRSHVAVGRLTTIYGLGQIIGPLATTSLTIRTGRYDAALIATALVLSAGAALLYLGLTVSRRPSR